MTGAKRHNCFFIVLTIAFFFTFQHINVYAQTGVPLSSEIQNIEREIARQGISASERHAALVRLANLRRLSGDIEGAARNWLEAAAAIPGRVDDDALLSCAYCLAAMGEWDRASSALQPLLSKMPRARFLDVSIRAIETGDHGELGSLVDNPEYAGLKTEIIFVLWKISRGDSKERWRMRLVNEFPQTIEGRLARDAPLQASSASSSITVMPSPFWLFAGGLDSLSLIEQSAGAFAAKLQTGIFSRLENAQAQETSLRQAGFPPSIESRTVNGTQFWAVTVPSGADENRTITRLLEAGFESFPVR